MRRGWRGSISATPTPIPAATPSSGCSPARSIVGGTGLHRRRGPDTLEIGYWVHADHLGQGFATEAATALTTAAFAVPGIEHVEIHHDRANTASRGIPERLGYRMVAESPDAVTAPGEEGVDCCWRTDRRGWPPSAIARARHSPR